MEVIGSVSGGGGDDIGVDGGNGVWWLVLVLAVAIGSVGGAWYWLWW